MDFSTGGDAENCQHCGAHVSSDFRRTFGDAENRAHRCLSCDSRPRIQAGSAAGVKVEYPDPEEQQSRNRGPRVPATDGGVVGGEQP